MAELKICAKKCTWLWLDLPPAWACSLITGWFGVFSCFVLGFFVIIVTLSSRSRSLKMELIQHPQKHQNQLP